MTEAQLLKEIVKIAISVDDSWKYRGWASEAVIVDVGFDGTGKIIDVIMNLATMCSICSSAACR